MPIFMDRHDATGVTQEQAAQMHLEDLAVQDRYGVRFLTYWFEEERGSAFCLIEAPDAATAHRAHQGSHGQTASEIIEVDLSAVEAFLGRIHDPRPASSAAPVEVDGGFRAVMFTDIAGSTEMTARLGDRLATEAIRAHNSLVRRALRRTPAARSSIPATASWRRSSGARLRSMAPWQSSARSPTTTRPARSRSGCASACTPGSRSRTATICSARRFSWPRGCAMRPPPEQILCSDVVRQACPERSDIVAAGSRRLKGFAQPTPSYTIEWR